MNTDSGKPSQDPRGPEAWMAAGVGRLDLVNRRIERGRTGSAAGQACNGRRSIAARTQSERLGAVQDARTVEPRAAHPRFATEAADGVRPT